MGSSTRLPDTTALHSVDVRSVVSGNLLELPIAEGDIVEENQILAQVDSAAQNAT
ncbi:MAG: biotin/lipoyl-binding protein, partial [Pseudomonadota bacterium]